ncbi:MAG: Gfo/Idh/MocA family oxidoreductase [Thermoguttaceae bacterium]
MSQAICRWGILGAAEIARKNWLGIHNAENCALTAVASRDLERCRRFIADCQRHAPFDPPPQAFGSYAELLASDTVDAVYAPLPTSIRKAWLIRAAEAGKHVLAEKPVGATAADVQEILAACRRNGVQFMDGVMFMHSRRLERIRAVLNDGESVGPIRRIVSQFSFGVPPEFFRRDIRTHSGLEPLGCLGDLGWYCIRFTLWVLQGMLPAKVCGHLLASHQRPDSPAPVPTEFSAELFFPEGVSASLYCSFLAENQQWANVGGSKGFIHVPDFVLPHYGSEAAFEVCNAAFHVAGCDFNMEDHRRRVAVREYSNSAPNSQEANMFRTFAALALSGRPDDTWGAMVLKTQQVLDACVQSAASEGRMVEITLDGRSIPGGAARSS